MGEWNFKLPEHVVEAFVLGRATAEQTAAVGAELLVNPQLVEYVSALRGESTVLRDVLSTVMITDADLDEETLALYLDGALTDEVRQQIEQRLAGNPAAQQRLVSIYREVQEVLTSRETTASLQPLPSEAPALTVMQGGLEDPKPLPGIEVTQDTPPEDLPKRQKA